MRLKEEVFDLGAGSFRDSKSQFVQMLRDDGARSQWNKLKHLHLQGSAPTSRLLQSLPLSQYPSTPNLRQCKINVWRTFVLQKLKNCL